MDSKYIEEAKKINKTYLVKDEEGDAFCKDRYLFHNEWDDLICKILKENGYTKISKMYERATDFFWYD